MKTESEYLADTIRVYDADALTFAKSVAEQE